VTPFTELVGCRVPIQLAGMGGVVTPELAAAVTNAGGLGMIGVPMLPPAVVAALLEQIGKLARGPFGATFLIPFLDRAALEVAASRARVVELFYGDPDPAIVETIHRAGALASWQVGSCAEAVAAERAGCDLIVAQCAAAGGHVRGTIELFPLLSQVLDAVRVPVLAAGGIATARAVAGALAAGASGVRVGTRFLAAKEADMHPTYLAALVAARAEDTVLTTAYSVGWPDAPHRVLRSAVSAAEALATPIAGETPIGGAVASIPRFGVYPPLGSTTGRVDAMALYAGESVGAIERAQPAAEIVRELADGAERLLRARA
jgi:NAD(P)H-dependent flavin oxidoreductase YrpB (nitropropane dioxygenase family)